MDKLLQKVKDLYFYILSEQIPIIAVINNERKKWRKKWSMDKTLSRKEESAGAFIQRCSVQFFEKFCKIHRKTFVLESFYKGVSGLETCNFVKKWFQQRCFPNKFLRKLFYKISANSCLWIRLVLGVYSPFWSLFRGGEYKNDLRITPECFDKLFDITK